MATMIGTMMTRIQKTISMVGQTYALQKSMARPYAASLLSARAISVHLAMVSEQRLIGSVM